MINNSSYNSYTPQHSIIGTLVFPGRKSPLPAWTVPEYPATAYPTVLGADYVQATYPLSSVLGFSDKPYNPSETLPKNSIVNDLVFPGRKSPLPAWTVPEYPAVAYPSPRGTYNDFMNDFYRTFRPSTSSSLSPSSSYRQTSGMPANVAPNTLNNTGNYGVQSQNIFALLGNLFQTLAGRFSF